MKQIYIHIFHLGSFARPVGDVCTESEDLVVDFVIRVVREYGFQTLPLSSLQCFVFSDDNVLVRVRTTEFLGDKDVIYVCPINEVDDMERNLLKKVRKESKLKMEVSARLKEETSDLNLPVAGKLFMGKTTMQRLEFHKKNLSNPAYSK